MTHDRESHHESHREPQHESQHESQHTGDRAHPVGCDEALEKLFDFLDGELDESFEARLRAHVGRCDHCTDVADFERRFLEVLHAARGGERCPKRLRDRVIATLRAEGLGA